VVWQDGVGDELVRGSDGSSKGSRSLIHDAQAAAPKVVPAATVGRLLRSARERQGLGLDEVEATLLIRTAQLRAIEDDRFDALPAEAYARGFVRTYAEYLGLDGDQMVQLFNEQWSATRFRPAEEHPHVSTPIATADESARRHGRRLMVFAACALAASLSIFVFARLAGSGQPGHELRLASPPGSAPPRIATPRPATQPPGATPSEVRVVITAPGGPCWLQARAGSATGRVMSERTLYPGQADHLRGSRIWVRLGDPTNIRLRVDQHDRPLEAGAEPINLMITPGAVKRV